jgi:hypothetical protein
MQYFNDRIENFGADYYLCMQNNCNLFHVHNWIQFLSQCIDTITNHNFELKEMTQLNCILT